MDSRFFDSGFASLEAYVPGEQPKDRKYIKLNTNESPFPPSPAVVEAINGDAASLLRLYSDPTSSDVKGAIAEFYGIDTAKVFVTNGSDEGLNFLFMAFSEKGTAFADITYGFYSVFADLYHKDTTIVPLREDFSINIDDYDGIDKTIFIANPNAPTGMILGLDVIENLIARNPDRLIVVDEAYVDFGGESAVALTEKYDNVAVVQTFSKSRSLAGARLGFVIANPAIIAGLEKIKYSTNPYNVNRLTALAGKLSMNDREYFVKTRNTIIENRTWTMNELKARGFEMTDSKTNFIFVRHPGLSGETYFLALRQRGILVRHFTGKRICEYNRITVGSREEMEALIAVTDEILREAGVNHD
ncbi:MAG: histidinol-phosphate transaminase [Clostridia bacterium]|nr:histidinol-phosphate transaminase [Clostridia bacterium]